jgi:glucosamine--fructose-6-phosphate aminotransferase (isomerizing)
MTVVARGVNYGTGFEIALKIRELSGLVTEAYSPADLMHGPIAAIQPGWPVVVAAPTGPARPSVEEIVPPLRAQGARLVAVLAVRAALRRAQTKLVLASGVPEWLSPLTVVVPGQVAAMRLASLRGLDLDSPVGIRKVTLPRWPLLLNSEAAAPSPSRPLRLPLLVAARTGLFGPSGGTGR